MLRQPPPPPITDSVPPPAGSVSLLEGAVNTTINNIGGNATIFKFGGVVVRLAIVNDDGF